MYEYQKTKIRDTDEARISSLIILASVPLLLSIDLMIIASEILSKSLLPRLFTSWLFVMPLFGFVMYLHYRAFGNVEKSREIEKEFQGQQYLRSYGGGWIVVAYTSFPYALALIMLLVIEP